MNRKDPIAGWFANQQSLLCEDHPLPPLPKIEISDEPPPAFREDPHLEELYRGSDEQLHDSEKGAGATIDVETWLGCYNAKSGAITIWRRGIELAARLIKQSYQTIFDLVLVHELGHWFHHRANTPKGTDWSDEAWEAAEREYQYHEAWAQWFAWVYANNVADKDMIVAFMELEKRQSTPYKAWREAFGIEHSEQWQRQVLASFDRLRACREPLNLPILKQRDLSKQAADMFDGMLGAI
jgi:hypothetical protein